MIEKDDSLLDRTLLSAYFSVDRKSFFKSFRLDRRDKGSMVLFRRLFAPFVEKVSRMDVMATDNTSDTDDRLANCRKSENSLFLSKKRDERVVKIFARGEKKCSWDHLVIIYHSSGIDMFWCRKWRKNRKNPFPDFCGTEHSYIFSFATNSIHSQTGSFIFTAFSYISMTSISFFRIFRKFQCRTFDGMFYVRETIENDCLILIWGESANGVSCSIPILWEKVDSSLFPWKFGTKRHALTENPTFPPPFCKYLLEPKAIGQNSTLSRAN